MTKSYKQKEELNFTTSYELAEHLIKLAKYIKSLPNIQLVPKKQMQLKVEKIRMIKEKFEKEIEGKSLEDIREILSRKKKRELEEIARGI